MQKLTASDGGAEDEFGSSVAIENDTVLIGAHYDTVFANIDQGSGYIFGRNEGGTNNWGQVRKLTASDGSAGDEFGGSVALNNDTIVIGASGDDVGANLSQGSAYVFDRNLGGADNWGQVRKLIASDGLADDLFSFRSPLTAIL